MGNNSTSRTLSSFSSSSSSLSSSFLSSFSSSTSSASFLFPSTSNSSSNTSDTVGVFSLFDLTWITVSISDMMSHCSNVEWGAFLWLGFEIFIFVTALLANSALLWLLFKSRHNLSPSQLLALNIAIINILYCLCLSVNFYAMLNQTSDIVYKTIESLKVLKVFGCPLFLTLMCLERYIGAAFPLLYLHFRNWKHRVILCVVSWIWIISVLILSFFFQTFLFALSLVVIIVLLFLIMLLCLAGIVFVLCQSGPGGGASSSDSLKRRALVNIIMVIVPSAMAYFPLVVLVGYLAFIISRGTEDYTPEQCTVMNILLACPSIGLYIGPLFYLSRIKKMTCCKKQVENTTSPTQAEERVDALSSKNDI